MSRLTLHWHLKALDLGPAEDDDASNDADWHDPMLVSDALRADDPVEYLNQARFDPVISPEQREHAADLLTRHFWPDDAGHQKATVVQTGYTTDEDGGLVTIYSVDRERMQDDGYHIGGLWWPHVPGAGYLTCPECGLDDEFWDFERVDAGEAYEPDLRCPHCKWEPPQPEATV